MRNMEIIKFIESMKKNDRKNNLKDDNKQNLQTCIFSLIL